MRTFLCFSFFLVSGLVGAQNLPQQQACFPGSMAPGCPPPDAPGWNAITPVAPTPRDPRAIKRRFSSWAAIAHNPLTSSLGMAGQQNDESDKEEAEKIALDSCSANGGGAGCTILIAYKAECAAIAVGMNPDGKAELHAEKGRTEEKASGKAMMRCSKSGANCKPLYANCVSESFYFDGWE